MKYQEIERRFTYWAPGERQEADHVEARAEAKRLAHTLNSLLPDGREKSLALTAIEECLMWANAAIARPLEERS